MPARVYDDQLMEFPDDPLARALLPPRNEKPAAREARLHAEREAKKRSDMIDEDISRQRAEDRKGMKPVKILLLGQSESGKSTTLKNFQLMNSRQAFSAERETWRTVIQLNLVRSIHIILDTLTDVLAAQTDPRLPRRSSTYSDPRRSYPSSVDSTSALASAHAVLTIRPPSPSRSGRPGTARTIDSTLDGAGHMTEWDASTLTTGPSLSSSSGPRLTPEHVKLRTRLAALLPIEDDLRRRFAVAEPDLLGAAVTTPTVPAAGSKGSDGALSPPSAPPPAQPAKRPRPRTGTITRSSARKGEGSSGSRPSTAGSSRSSGSGGNNTNASGGLAPLNTNLPFLRDARAPKELAVLSAHGWKSAIGRMMAAGGGVNSVREVKGEVMGADPGRMLAACAEDIKALWGDPVVRAVLAERKVRVEEMSGFFLDSLDRVTSPSYVPSDDDILRARLKTLGVSEYRFTFKASHSMYHDWRVYDVGGQRSLRAAWVPFFDDMDGIIFLAPVSCFDQVLEEDENVNRIEDSVLLWKSIVSNPLLAKTNLVLFLNKCDILKKKLDSGTRFAKYVLSYGDRPNDFESVAKYLKRKFSGLLRDCSPEPRQFYCHLTSVIDTKTTFTILESVQDMVVRANLKASHLVD